MKRHPGYSDAGFKLGYTLARVLPRAICRGIGSLLGLASYFTNDASHAALRENLRCVVESDHDRGQTDASRLERLCRDNFRNFGRMLADYFFCTAAQPANIRALLDEWHGIDNLKAALAKGRGVVLITAHLGNWELGGTLLALDGWPINVVTLEEPTGELTRTRDEYRQRLGIRTIAVGENKFAFVEMIAALRRNEIVCMLVDRPYAETGAPVNFFGRETAFSSAPVLLWQHTGAAIIPAFVLQNPSGRYHAFAEPAIALETIADRRESLARNTQHIATAFEKIIRPHPEQWFNYVPIWKNETPQQSS